ncbi:hypothetical protein [Rathayibacter sp. AY1F2]|uniref:hypothetical protein n=1 Tax=Rathayibacter sp. AY1F2 TaxID=2080557 RepID=UPI002157972C|nr:hypothetical protein [Rathayibacter sp. AY1F2]
MDGTGSHAVEDDPLPVLGLDDERAVPGEQQMVDLREEAARRARLDRYEDDVRGEDAGQPRRGARLPDQGVRDGLAAPGPGERVTGLLDLLLRRLELGPTEVALGVARASMP